jgi:hypothetical protein
LKERRESGRVPGFAASKRRRAQLVCISRQVSSIAGADLDGLHARLGPDPIVRNFFEASSSRACMKMQRISRGT